MGLTTKEVEIILHNKVINYYKNLGYNIPRVKGKWGLTVPHGSKIIVKVEDLTDCSKINVNVECDGCGENINIRWQDYKKCVKEDNKYYCKKCANNDYKKWISFEQWCLENNCQDILGRWDYELNDCNPNEICCGSNKKYYFCCHTKMHSSELKNINNLTSDKQSNIDCNQCNSFGQWCINNNKKDILNLWDYELNNCSPNEVNYGSGKSYYFKCFRKIHVSELKKINKLTSRHEIYIQCNYCNSFAQWGIDNLGEDFLEKYWDYEKNKDINPWEISYVANTPKVWIKCQEKDYHGSYETTCNGFTNNKRCPCCKNKKVHKLDSLGSLYSEIFKIWSNKNKKSPYEYAPNSGQQVWWKCLEGKHDDYKRKISGSNTCNFRCPECQYSQGEDKISQILISKNFVKISQEEYDILDNTDKIKKKYYIPQKTFGGLIGLGNCLLSYDFYLPQYNLLIEYQGEFHDGTAKKQSKEEFKKQQEHDKRKREYAKSKNIKLLEIWYHEYENIEVILKSKVKI
jgi:hypothetical protein